MRQVSAHVLLYSREHYCERLSAPYIADVMTISEDVVGAD